MPAFTYEWDNFGGGYYVGPSAVNQPKNTWQGANITLSDDDATLVPTYGPQKLTLTGTGVTSGVLSNGTSATTWSEATYFNGYVVLMGATSTATYVYFIKTSDSTVTRVLLSVGGTDVTGVTLNTPPVVVPTTAGDVIAYVAVGKTAIYQITRSSSAVAAWTPSGNTILLTGLTIWNARMIAWGSAADTVLFSDALTFAANWSSLNFISVGYANDGISYCVPRNLDLLVVKPSGWYTITGVLGVNTAVRQLNDTLGILPTDPVEQHNNTAYFITSTGTNNYAVNLLAISGSRVDVAAYQRFGLSDSNIAISKTNMGYLAVASVIEDTSSNQYANIYLLNHQDRWQVFKMPASVAYSDTLRYSVARAQVSRYNTAQDQKLYLCESVTGATVNSMTIHAIRPTTVEPGKLSASDAPATAILKLQDVATKMPVIIRRVYVEAEMIQIPVSPYTGSASIQARVNNKAVGDIAFSQTTGDVSSDLSTAYTFPYSTFTSVTNTSYSQIRVLRFNVDDATYGYTNEIEIQFAGLRIRRVWVEGDSR
jgi:hypothetical protein